MSPVAPWLRDFCCSAGTPKRLWQEPGKADVKWSENYPNDINDIPCLRAALFSSWNHMEPLLRFPARQLTNTASIRKYMVYHGMLSVFCLGLDSHKPSKKSCYSNRINRQLFTNWMIKLKPFNPFEVDVCHLFFRKRGVPERSESECSESRQPLTGITGS